MAYSWKCPYCNNICTIGENDIFKNQIVIEGKSNFTKDLNKGTFIDVVAIHCPNSDCNGITLVTHINTYNKTTISMFDGKYNTNLANCNKVCTIKVLPENHGNIYPDYIPEAILNDYKEAYAILDLSPKASATLSRRCLQGMLRDFWKVKPDTLFNEIREIQDKVTSQVWKAIDAVRSIGNIGAHMEKDINLIIDVEPKEAKLLIQLIEFLIEDWYIARHEREERLSKIEQSAANKKAIKANPTP